MYFYDAWDKMENFIGNFKFFVYQFCEASFQFVIIVTKPLIVIANKIRQIQVSMTFGKSMEITLQQMVISKNYVFKTKLI